MHCWLSSWLTSPTVLRKNEGVHSDGSVRRCGNSAHDVRTAPHDESRHIRGQRVRIGTDAQVDGVLLVLLVLLLHIFSRRFFNSVCMSEGPFISGLKARGFLAHLCNT
jgi:hypothetical protein